MCPPSVGLAHSPALYPPMPPFLALSRLHLNLRHLSCSLPTDCNIQPPPRSHQGRRSPSPRCALYLVFLPLHPYYLFGRKHKRTAMNIMSLCNLAAHATRRRVVCLTRLHWRCTIRRYSPRDVVAKYLGPVLYVCYNATELRDARDLTRIPLIHVRLRYVSAA